MTVWMHALRLHQMLSLLTFLNAHFSFLFSTVLDICFDFGKYCLVLNL